VSWSLWNNSSVRFISDVTFRLVEFLLRPFFTDMTVDRAQLTIGTPRFAIQVGDACSGLEGIGLIVVFSIIWLVVFRHECRFPRALLIIPAGVIIVFLLNTVRIASLFLIGNAGAPEIALGGFHSQAGWIGFNLVALGCSFVVPRVSWLSTRNSVSPQQIEQNPTVPWLLPFALVLGAGMISRAASAGFEWLYPIRVIAAVAGLWIYRRSYAWRGLVPRLWWDAVAAGAVVFVMWVVLDRGSHQDNGLAAGLAALPQGARAVWLLFRVLGAVITVPVVEELAFRGFLLRRLVSRDFESVSFQRFTWVALIVSSLAFGLMHGDRWIAGSLAGAVYAAVMIRRGHLGSAILAHATTNAMLAAWVLLAGRWQYW
jgi:exosortase E/protease (VPEID-CTERM system)